MNRLTQLRPYAAACIVWALQALGAAALAQTITPSNSDTSSVTGSLIPAATAPVSANAFRALAEPTLKVYSNTTLTACPPGEELQYFVFDTRYAPQYRSSTWCGSAALDIQRANDVAGIPGSGVYVGQLPLLLEECVAGDYWSYSHACGPGSTCSSPPDRWYSWKIYRTNLVCKVSELELSLSGPGSVVAPPAKDGAPGASPAPNVIATVTRAGAPAAGIGVTVTMGGQSASGSTDSAGQFKLTYVPPFYRYDANPLVISATCDGCTNNPQTANITVRPSELEPPPDMCAADDPGRLEGNPIAPGTGEKRQTESDYADAGAHGLSLTRGYSSAGAVDAGFGPGWSHGFAATVIPSAAPTPTEPFPQWREVRLGADASVRFTRADAASAWQAISSADRLALAPDGAWRYTRASDDATYAIGSLSGQLLSITDRGGLVHTLGYDANGRLTSVTNAFGRTLGFAWSVIAAGTGTAPRITRLTAPDGQTIDYAYDTAARLASATYPVAASATPTPRRYHYENPAFPNALTGITDETGTRFASFGYDAMGRAVSTQHAGLPATSVSYPPQAAADNAQYPSGRLITGAPDPSLYQAQVQVTDPSGGAHSWTYQGGDGTVRLLGASGPYQGGQIASRGFASGSGLPELETDFLGVNTLFTWDSARRLKTGTTRAAGRPEQQTVQTQWHPTWALPLNIAQQGRNTQYTYDTRGNTLTRAVQDTASGQTRLWTYTYTAQNLLATETAPNGAQTQHQYDALGNRTQTQDALGRLTRWSHDGAGRILTQSDPSGLVTGYTYSPRGQLLAVNQGGLITQMSYTPSGQLASLAQPDGLITQYTYDSAQRLTGSTNNRGASTGYVLDPNGNRIAETIQDASGVAWSLTRLINSLGQTTAQTQAGQANAWAYDANGSLISSANGLGQASSSQLDGLRRITALTNPLGASATLQYNGLDAITQAGDYKGVATQYTRAEDGNPTQETSADIGTRLTQYDALGLPIQTQDGAGRNATITRDSLGRPTRIQYGDGSASTLSYTPGGQIAQRTDPGITTTATHDNLGRITSLSQTLAASGALPAASQSASYSYVSPGQAGAGQIATITYPGGQPLGHQYDASGRLTGLTWNGQPLIQNIQTNALGQVTAWQWAFNGQGAQRRYNEAGQLVQTELISVQRDAAGRISQIGQTLMAPTSTPKGNGAQASGNPAPFQLSTGLAYDAAGRLSAVVHQAPQSLQLPPGISLAAIIGAPTTAYVYDANGNRSQSHYHGAWIPPTANTNGNGNNAQGSSANLDLIFALNPQDNRISGYSQSVNGASSVQAITYDASGAITAQGATSLGYDARGMLASASNANGLSSYRHNSLAQRVQKNAQGQSTSTLYGPEQLGLQSQPLSQQQGANTLHHIYLPTPQGPLPVALIVNNSTKLAIHSDHLGTPRRITSSTGEVLWQWVIAGYGEVPPTTSSQAFLNDASQPRVKIANGNAAGASVSYDLRYPGQQADAETGLFYNHHRSYDPFVGGRYTQADPIGLVGGWNRWGYVNGNPLKWADPMGLAIPAAVIACMSNPLCAATMAGAAAATAKACIDLGNLVFNRPKNPPDIGPPNGWIQGPRRGRLYGPDGRPQLDIDKPHQGNDQDHAHEWPNGEREEPGRPVSPWPQQ